MTTSAMNIRLHCAPSLTYVFINPDFFFLLHANWAVELTFSLISMTKALRNFCVQHNLLRLWIREAAYFRENEQFVFYQNPIL